MRVISLTQGLTAKVDDDVYERLMKHSWCLLDLRVSRRGLVYAQTRTNYKLVYMHHMVMPKRVGFVVDHVNGDGLDNRRENLRYVTDADNKKNRRHLSANNSTGVNGVSWDKERERFKVDIQVGGTTKFVGRFASLTEAVKARQSAELQFWGKIYSKGKA